MKRYSSTFQTILLYLLVVSFGLWAQPVHFHCHTAESHSHPLDHRSAEHSPVHHHDHIVHVHALEHVPADAAAEDSDSHSHHEHYAKADPYRVVSEQKDYGNGRQGQTSKAFDAWAHPDGAQATVITFRGHNPNWDVPIFAAPTYEPDRFGKRTTGLSPPFHT